MYTWTDLQTQFKNLANNSNTDATTFGKFHMNQGLHILEADLGTFVIEDTRTGSTIASTLAYNLPEGFIRLKQLYVTVGTIQYNCSEVFDEDTWRSLQSYTSGVTSNFASKVFVRRNTFEIYPKPSTANTYTLIYERESPDLSVEDYSTGTITTLANGGTTVTGSGTAWDASMGFGSRFFQITANQQWYEISSNTSATVNVLRSAYQQTAISAGSATYRIGQMPRTPGPTHVIPLYYALMLYYTGFRKDAHFGPMYSNLYDKWTQWAKDNYGRRYSTAVIPSQRNLRQRSSLINPNFYPNPVT